jgi:hypothetical protein
MPRGTSAAGEQSQDAIKRSAVERSAVPDMNTAYVSRPEGTTQDSSRLWKVGMIFAVALGFVMAMLDVTVGERRPGRHPTGIPLAALDACVDG